MANTGHLVIAGLRKGFADTQVLGGIDLQVDAGEFIALVGPSGCGKSTLLRIIAGLESADSGTLTLDGQDLTGLGTADRNIAMVFQSYALYPHLTAGQNMAVPLMMRRLSALARLPFVGAMVRGRAAVLSAIRAEVNQMAETLKIAHLLARKPGQMSGGQRQRVALGRAMVRRPALFLMDEPLSNLDANLRVHARGEIVEMHRRSGVPTLYVTHDQAEALSMADRVAVMIGGAVLQIAPPREIYDNPTHIEVARFIGQPQINLIPASVTGGTIQVGAHIFGRVSAPDGPISLGIRPEHLRPAQNGLPAIVARVEFLGAEVVLHCRTLSGAVALQAQMPPADAANWAAGDAITLAAPAHHILAFAANGHRVTAPVHHHA
ncbi:iron(III) transport system ATP-binding protein [Ketogulonicigenium robustum]|uniref:Iron(III) transport system ATP-binding protein n=2 Tax=Ketogulonicigenium robustum TaxID=92947 RepID=A0A1W6NXJ4_9RHOB|nr:iron(III) transport system ATP-binding protein [Ketogulonicigenium robustum]